jgi:hypothetical protein
VHSLRQSRLRGNVIGDTAAKERRWLSAQDGCRKECAQRHQGYLGSIVVGIEHECHCKPLRRAVATHGALQRHSVLAQVLLPRGAADRRDLEPSTTPEPSSFSESFPFRVSATTQEDIELIHSGEPSRGSECWTASVDPIAEPSRALTQGRLSSGPLASDHLAHG